MRTRSPLLCLLACLAATLPARADDLAELERMRARRPDDAVVLYQLAAVHAAAGERAATLRSLDAVSRAPGGLDPSAYRGFAFLHGDRAFERIVARIRAANPPLVRSQPAFTIAERDLRPEGIAFDPVRRSTLAGSFKGKIVRIDADGTVHDFATVSSAELPRVVVGLRVDAARRRLWAVVDDPRAFTDPTVAGAALQVWDLDSGALVARHDAATRGAFNDVVVTPAGDAYATNTSTGAVWRASPGRTAMVEVLPAGAVEGANGIAVSADGRYLFIAGWHDVQRLDLRSGAMRPLESSTRFPTGSFDGLYFYAGGLIGIQNGVHPGRVVRLHLDPSLRRVERAEVLERYHPLFDGVTTAALDGASLLYFANTQSRSFKPDGSLIEGATTHDIVVLRLPLAH